MDTPVMSTYGYSFHAALQHKILSLFFFPARLIVWC